MKTYVLDTPETTPESHTPGEWTTGALMTRVEVWPDGWNAPLLIADCHGKHAPESGAERVANARLIAAAPELFSACIEMRSLLDDLGIVSSSTRDKADAAIAKARGGSK